MVITDLEHIDPVYESTDIEGGLSLMSLLSSLPSSGSGAPAAFAFTHSSVEATGANFALVGSVNTTRAISTPFFAAAFASSTSFAIAG